MNTVDTNSHRFQGMLVSSLAKTYQNEYHVLSGQGWPGHTCSDIEAI